jgi:HK97 family phage prohead protease
METKRRYVAAEIKATEEGTIEGYGSVFGDLDSYSDVVAPNAFKRTLTEAKNIGRMPAMLWQHNPEQPIGVWTEMREDNHGLVVKGKLADTTMGRDAHNLMKLGALTGLSIGYVTVESEVDKKTGVRTLLDVDLIEVSPVTFPALDSARISSVKNAEHISTERDFEEFLRDAGFSRTVAKTIVAKGYKAVLSKWDACEELDDLAAMLKKHTALLTSR